MNDSSEEWPIVFRSTAIRHCRDAALVLESQGIRCRTQGVGPGAILRVPAERAERALRELERWSGENRGWPPREAPPPPPVQADRLPFSLVLYAVVLLGMHGLAGRHVAGLDWVGAGLCDAQRVQSGEWWRCVTALTLHADGVHLAGNLLFGSWFALLLVRALGSGVAWAGILAAGALGNAINVLWRSGEFRSLGASTAVFATVGILAVLGFRHKGRSGARWVRRIGPLVVGLWILAFLGTSGGRTDVLGHCCGLAAGIATGLVLTRHEPSTSPAVQRAGKALVVLVLGASWALALLPR